MLDLRAAAAVAEQDTAEQSRTPLGAAKRRAAKGTATRSDLAEMDAADSRRAGAVARQREAARTVVETVDALIASGVKVDPERVYLMGADHLDRDGEQLDARTVVADHAAAAAKRGRIGIASPVSGRYTLPQWRTLMLRSAGPLNRRAAEARQPLTDGDRADLVSAMTADLAAVCGVPTVEATMRRRVRGPITREQARRADLMRPGMDHLMPRPADLPTDLDRLAYNAARRWHRDRAANLAAQVPVAAAEQVPADDAPDDFHALREGLAAVEAAEIAARRVDLKLSSADRWTVRTALTGMSSATLAALYGVAHSTVRVSSGRGAEHMETVPAEQRRAWAQGTGRILAALDRAPDPDAPIRAAMRPDVTRNRDARIRWADRVPTIKRDRETGRLIYTDAPAHPNVGTITTRVAPWPIYGCQTPARILRTAPDAPRPFKGFSARAVPISTLDTRNARRAPQRTRNPVWTPRSTRPRLDLSGIAGKDIRKALDQHREALKLAGEPSGY